MELVEKRYEYPLGATRGATYKAVLFNYCYWFTIHTLSRTNHRLQNVLSLRILYHFGLSVFVYQADIQHAMSLSGPFSSLIRLLPHSAFGFILHFQSYFVFCSSIAAFSLRILQFSYLVGLLGNPSWTYISGALEFHRFESGEFISSLDIDIVEKPFELVFLILSISNPA